jgi:hypothetical protein
LTFINEGVGHGKRQDPAAQREMLLHALRTGTARARLNTSTLETIAVQLRHRQITTEQATRWIHDEGLDQYLQLGPKGGAL